MMNSQSQYSFSSSSSSSSGNDNSTRKAAAKPTSLRVNDYDELATVIGNEFALVVFSASFCHPCKLAKLRIYNEDADKGLVYEFPRCKFYYIDIEECMDLADELEINAIPVFMIFYNGQTYTIKKQGIAKAIEQIKRIDYALAQAEAKSDQGLGDLLRE